MSDNQLIEIKVKNHTQLVSARELHKGLGLKKKFSAWWEQNSEDFEENTDYTREPKGYLVQSGNGAVKSYDDYLFNNRHGQGALHDVQNGKGKRGQKIFY